MMLKSLLNGLLIKKLGNFPLKKKKFLSMNIKRGFSIKLKTLIATIIFYKEELKDWVLSELIFTKQIKKVKLAI